MPYLVWLFILIVIVLGIAWEQSELARVKEHVRREIKLSGGKMVSIEKNHKYSNEHTRAFSVAFYDSTGKSFKSVCVTTDGGQSFFWQKSPQELMGAGEAERQLRRDRLSQMEHPQQTAVSLSSKEQIIADLHAENERLRQQLAQSADQKSR